MNTPSSPTAPASPAPTRHVSLTPFCGDLRSKKIYTADQIPATPEDIYDHSGHCWCYHTQLPIGPDGRHAYPEACTPTRGCYRSALAKPL